VFDGKPFKDEFNSRLKFSRRGIVGMASQGPNSNQSQFFITLAPAPELNRKHTIFARVAGDTIFNVLKIAEAQVDEQERPLIPITIQETRVQANPFDIVPRQLKQVESIESAPESIDLKKTKKYGCFCRCY
jgi:peptidyl-prolyl cis-trans isomerase SDCCAG10